MINFLVMLTASQYEALVDTFTTLLLQASSSEHGSSTTELSPDRRVVGSCTGEGLLDTPPIASLVHETSRGTERRRVSTCPIWEQQAPNNRMTLPEVYRLLGFEDDFCILAVRKIHKLGFKSVKYLREYFSQFGKVSKIILLPARAKGESPCVPGAHASVRPASMAFLVMSSRVSAALALSQPVHWINDWPIAVNFFIRASLESQPA